MSAASYARLIDFSANGFIIHLSGILNVIPNLTRFTLAPNLRRFLFLQPGAPVWVRQSASDRLLNWDLGTELILCDFWNRLKFDPVAGSP